MLRHKNKKTWIIGISVLSVALMISSSFGVAAESINIEEATQFYIPSGDEEESLLSLSISGNEGPSVDIELTADENGIVDVPVYVDAVELNIIGRAGLEIIDGSDNLARPPIFAGLDGADNIILSILAMSVISIVTVAKLLKDSLGIIFSVGVTIGLLIAAGLLSAFATAVAAGSIAFLTVFFTGGALFSILDGNGIPDSLKATIRAILTGIENVLTGVYYLVKDWAEDFDINTAIDKVKNFLNDAKDVIISIAQTSLVGVAGIIMAFKYMKETPDWAEIKATLIQLGISSYNAQIIVNKLQDSYDSIVDIRDSVFGAIDFFVTMGSTHKAIRNLYVVIDESYEGGDDEYVAVMKVKALSAGNQFDVQTIGIKFDGFPEDPDGESLLLEGEQMESTTFGSETTEETLLGGTTVLGGTSSR